jgi:hypothetical protein
MRQYSISGESSVIFRPLAPIRTLLGNSTPQCVPTLLAVLPLQAGDLPSVPGVARRGVHIADTICTQLELDENLRQEYKVFDCAMPDARTIPQKRPVMHEYFL